MTGTVELLDYHLLLVVVWVVVEEMVKKFADCPGENDRLILYWGQFLLLPPSNLNALFWRRIQDDLFPPRRIWKEIKDH